MKSAIMNFAAIAVALALCFNTSVSAGTRYVDGTSLNLIGKLMPTPNPYHRVDTVKYKGFTPDENIQIRCGAGLALMFKTNSRSISVRAGYGYIDNFINTMPLSLRGWNLFIKGSDGQWISAATWSAPAGRETDSVTLISGMDGSMHECILYLPIYSEVFDVQVGVDDDAEISYLESPFRHRVAIFGSSYTQGISTSRAGMSYPSQFTRNTGIQLLNLGCSGNCKLQPYFAEVLKDADVDAIIFDAFSNPSAQLISERLFPFIESIQSAHPGIPLIFQKTIYREGRTFNGVVEASEAAKMAVADSLMKIAVKKYKDVYYIVPNAGGKGYQTSVDGIHPDDYGYSLWAKSIQKDVLKILRKYGIKASDAPESPAFALSKDGRIILKDNLAATRTAAELLQKFIGRICGMKPEIVGECPALAGDISLASAEPEDKSLEKDGFHIETRQDGSLLVEGKAKGCIYGVTALLEDCFGVRYMAADTYKCPKRSGFTIEQPLSRCENPAFSFRSTQSYAIATDPDYALFLRSERAQDVFAGGMWVHTFDRILPSSRFGETHPEWYSQIEGVRRPGKASQWCLSNPEVLEAAVAQLDSIFRANPEAEIISVSQNDGNFTYCHCEECQKLMDRYGSVSAPYILFMNALAERFPDKTISTLAYLFTMTPPKGLTVRPNVNIMLCDIDCDRERDLRSTAGGREFIEAMEGWSAISDNLFIWDYGINFDNYLSPFPNFHILQPNIRLFRDNHARMHFSQIAGSLGGNFSELRSYIVAKLMWNPDADVESLIGGFLRDYYGAAAPYIRQYMKLLEAELLKSATRLWIYDSPVTHKDGMLSAANRRKYAELFDRAEAAVKDDAAALRHVRMERLTQQYSELEIRRAQGIEDKEDTRALLALFESRCRDYGVPTLNERANSPLDYCRLYRERYLDEGKPNLARGAKVEYLTKPTGRYADMPSGSLTDGILGGTTFVESWVGWEGTDCSFVVDLGDIRSIREADVDCLHQLGSWVLFPKSVSVSISEDGRKWRHISTMEIGEDRDVSVKFRKFGMSLPTPVSARYIRFDVGGTITCPSWHYGIGMPSWFFIDEVFVHE